MKTPSVKLPATLQGWLALVLAVLATLGITVKVVVSTGEPPVIQFNVNTAQGPTTLTASTEAVEKVEKAQESIGHTELNRVPEFCDDDVVTLEAPQDVSARGPPPHCVTKAQYAAGVDQQHRMETTRPLPDLNPQAAGEIPGCKSRFIQRNYSSRGGIGPNTIWLHQTVSPDTGWAGVNAITAYFNRQGPDVSSHVVLSGKYDACNYIVPISQKAYTQAGFNRVAVGIEVTGTPGQGYYAKGEGRKRLLATIAYIARTWKIPVRRGSLSDCTVNLSGVVDHVQGGACAGNHSDINPNRGEIPGIIRDAARLARLGVPPETKQARWCRSLNIIRAQVRAGRTTPQRRARARELKTLLKNRDYACPA
jgi:hypothetical protein